ARQLVTLFFDNSVDFVAKNIDNTHLTAQELVQLFSDGNYTDTGKASIKYYATNKKNPLKFKVPHSIAFRIFDQTVSIMKQKRWKEEVNLQNFSNCLCFFLIPIVSRNPILRTEIHSVVEPFLDTLIQKRQGQSFDDWDDYSHNIFLSFAKHNRNGGVDNSWFFDRTTNYINQPKSKNKWCKNPLALISIIALAIPPEEIAEECQSVLVEMEKISSFLSEEDQKKTAELRIKTETVIRTYSKFAISHKAPYHFTFQPECQCRLCGRSVDNDTIALNRKLIDRNLNKDEIVCLNCMAISLNRTVENLRTKIKQYRQEGCKLFTDTGLLYFLH
ncbi:MAG: hypothetical protein LBC20_08615, partial [Planctomycetaceae bacterium]|nr:hypothetical protein [Planctomycetaceae bacterium]